MMFNFTFVNYTKGIGTSISQSFFKAVKSENQLLSNRVTKVVKQCLVQQCVAITGMESL
jgi:hypothetical protein